MSCASNISISVPCIYMYLMCLIYVSMCPTNASTRFSVALVYAHTCMLPHSHMHSHVHICAHLHSCKANMHTCAASQSHTHKSTACTHALTPTPSFTSMLTRHLPLMHMHAHMNTYVHTHMFTLTRHHGLERGLDSGQGLTAGSRCVPGLRHLHAIATGSHDRRAV